MVLQLSGTNVANEKIIVAGEAFTPSLCKVFLARYLSSGALDTSFGSSGTLVDTITGIPNMEGFVVRQVLLQDDGSIVVGGWVAVPGGDDLVALVRYTPSGQRDTSFGVANTQAGVNVYNGVVTVNLPGRAYTYPTDVVLDADDGILVLAEDDVYCDLIRFTPDGALDTTWGDSTASGGHTGFVQMDYVWTTGSIALQNVTVNGTLQTQILISGTFYETATGAYNNLLLARFNPNGSLDTSFNPNGYIVINDPRLSPPEIGHSLLVRPSDSSVYVLGGNAVGQFSPNLVQENF